MPTNFGSPGDRAPACLTRRSKVSGLVGTAVFSASLAPLHHPKPSRWRGPDALANVRQAMITAGRSRKLINKDVNRIRLMFGWAVENELLPVQVHQD